jgi:glycosyltransferase involved in cell wall biosynthesis
MDTLYIVVPCYNEQEVLAETAARLAAKLNSLTGAGVISTASRILLVDDGSRDRTWTLIAELCRADDRFAGVKLSRNTGHQNALLAGLTVAKEHCDMAISMDADLQDDIDAVDRFVDCYRRGFEVVCGVRSSRKKDTAFKRGTALGFYRLMKALGVEILYNHADYRLLSRRALEALCAFGEANLFLRGIVPLLGFSSCTVEYERGERFAGESKYPLQKMLAFALDGITAFSVKPLRLILWAGALVFAVSALLLAGMGISALSGAAVGSAPLICATVWMACGTQLLGLGVVGEYVGRTYRETKGRPRFIIDRIELR